MNAPATPARPVPDWFHNRVVGGLQFLLALGLPGTPASEVITLTAQAWVHTLWQAGPDWQEALDNARLERAFTAAAVHAERWPAPRAVLAHLEARPQPPRLPAPATSPSPEQRAALARLSRRWADSVKPTQGATDGP